MHAKGDTLLVRYDRACQHAAEQIIVDYSTSFRLATSVLGPKVRRDIRNLYAMVRTADEIVDGTAGAAGYNRAQVAAQLDAYEAAVLAAPATRFHTDPVLHAYAISARRCRFVDDHVRAFFSSMRRDLSQTTYDATDFDDYVYGSAEAIGLMCLAAFFGEAPRPPDWPELEHGARRLGAGFQKINFLRDLHEDVADLGRAYFPGTENGLDNASKDRIIADIRADLATARTCIPRLPAAARAGVMVAADLFERLTDQLAKADATELYTRRISVPPLTKTYLAAVAVARAADPRKRHA